VEKWTDLGLKMLSSKFRRLLAVTKPWNNVNQIRNYVAPINDLNFLIKDVHDFPSHYKKLGYDVEV
jgi:glycine cleavage system regulatory protein